MEEMNPLQTGRKSAFEDFRDCACPTIVATKKFDVTNLVSFSKEHNMKFNMLLCYLMAKSAQAIDAFLVQYRPYKLYRYDRICVNIVVNDDEDNVYLCDVPYTESLNEFASEYDRITIATKTGRCNYLLDDYSRLGTSAVVQTEMESISGGYNDKYTNPFLTWARYHKEKDGTITLPISLRVHHIQMDGIHVGRFLASLEQEIQSLK